MIKIGEFSKLVQVPVATLRYYDPSYVTELQYPVVKAGHSQ